MATFSYLQATTDTSDTNSYTFASQNLGTADAGRYIIVSIISRKATTSATISSVTIGGVSATITKQVTNTASNTNVAGIAIANVPTGATGDIVVTLSATMLRCAIGVYRATGLASVTAYDSDSSTATDPSVSLDVPIGFAVGVGLSAVSGGSASWTGLTENFDASLETYVNYTGASSEFASSESGRTITIDFTSSTEPAGVFASWEYASSDYTATPNAVSLTLTPNNPTVPLNRFWVGDSGNWNDTAHWAATSGGSGGVSVPTSSDNVYFDANSFSTTGQTVTVNVNSYLNDFDWLGATNNPTLHLAADLYIYGNFRLIEGMQTSSASSSNKFALLQANNGAKTITSAGQDLRNFNIYADTSYVYSDTWEIMDDLFATYTLYFDMKTAIDFGAFNLETDYVGFTQRSAGLCSFNGNEIRARIFESIGTIPPDLSGTTMYLTNTGSRVTVGSTTSTSTIPYGIVYMNGLYNMDYGASFEEFHLDGDLIYYASAEGHKAMSADQFYFADNAKLKFLVASLTMVQTSGTVIANGITLEYVNATGGATFRATNYIDNGNNTGWEFAMLAPTASLTLTPNDPIVTITDNYTASPNTVELVLTPNNPIVTTTASYTATPDTAELVLTPNNPTVTVTANYTAEPNTVELILTPNSPTVTTTTNYTARPNTVELTLTAYEPRVRVADPQGYTRQPKAIGNWHKVIRYNEGGYEETAPDTNTTPTGWDSREKPASDWDILAKDQNEIYTD